MDENEWQLLAQLLAQSIKPVEPTECRLYYDQDGRVVTYTCERLPGDRYIVITPEQFAEARPDVLVKEGQIVYTHKLSHTEKLVKNLSQGTRTSKYDVNVLVDADQDHVFWQPKLYEVT